MLFINISDKFSMIADSSIVPLIRPHNYQNKKGMLGLDLGVLLIQDVLSYGHFLITSKTVRLDKKNNVMAVITLLCSRD